MLPTSMILAGSLRQGVHSLAICGHCDFWLSSTAEEDAFAAPIEELGQWRRMLIDNGRALLSALYHGHLFLSTVSTPTSLAMLARLRCLIPSTPIVWPACVQAEGEDIPQRGRPAGNPDFRSPLIQPSRADQTLPELA